MSGKLLVIGGIVIALILGVFILKNPSTPNSIDNKPSDTNQEEFLTQPTEAQEQTQQPVMKIDKNKTYSATLKTTEGDIVIELNGKETPITVNNFISLAKKGFYNNTVFHRIIKGFMIQGGDPKGDGTGGPGYRFDNELFEGDYTRGTVAMANAGPNTNGSQFFIMHADYDLPKNYVIFGNVIEGIDVVDKIATAAVTQSPSGEQSAPENPIHVTKVEIEEK